MKYALVTLGSAGDLYPYLAMGRALRDAGHEVHVLSQAPYRAAAEAEGLSFLPIASDRDHQRTLGHPKLWHAMDGFGVLWRHLAVPAVESTVHALGQLAVGSHEPLGVIASPLAVGARFAYERWPGKVWWVSAYTAPLALRQSEGPLFVGTHRLPAWSPTIFKKLAWRALDRWKLEPMARSRLQSWQHQWGTSPLAASVFGDWVHSPVARLGLYPTCFASSGPADAEPRVHATGFPLYRPRGPDPLPHELLAFMARPGPMAVVYTGSAGTDGSLVETAIGCLEQAGYRVLHIRAFLHAQETAAVSVRAAEPPRRMQTTAIPLATVLPHASLLLHHGGIGTLAEGWAAGVPQLMFPHGYDQFDNAERARHLGLGSWIPAHAASRERIAAALRQLPQHAASRVPAAPALTPEAFDQGLLAWLNSTAPP
jgi:rhamnosyltransferase subunit B